MKADKPWALLAAGGTAGHILPAIVLAKELKARGHNVQMISSRRGPVELFANEGFPVTFFSTRGFRGGFRISSLIWNLRAAAELFSATLKLRRMFKQLTPQIAAVFGGYISVPVGLAARMKKVPLAIHESNASAGRANMFLSRFASSVLAAFEDCGLPGALVTGNPVRPEIFRVDRNSQAEHKKSLGYDPDNFLLAIVGGSLGSTKLNLLARDLPSNFEGVLSIHHVVGERDWEEFAGSAHSNANVTYRTVMFETQMAELYGAADLFICRAGSISTAELAAAGTPAILVPLPNAFADHQTKNAIRLAQAGGAQLIAEKSLTTELISAEIRRYMENPDELIQISEALRSLALPDAASRIADILEANAR